MPAKGRAPGNEARRRVVTEAAALATVVGLRGLTIGELAKRLDTPKSSLYVLFGSKEELQLATVRAARESFVREVVVPAYDCGVDGLDRLGRLADAFLDYVQRRVFPGGCFFVQAAAEMGAQRGAVHDLVAEYQGEWRQLLIQQATDAQVAGEYAGDPAQLAFEVGAILSGANLLAVLHDDDSACELARVAVKSRLAVGAVRG